MRVHRDTATVIAMMRGAQVGVIYRFDVSDGKGKFTSPHCPAAAAQRSPQSCCKRKCVCSGATKSWLVDLKNGDGSLKEGGEGKADCTIIIKDEDFVKLMSGLRARASCSCTHTFTCNSLVSCSQSSRASCVSRFTCPGKLNPQQAFMKGQLKLKGNMMLAQKLSLLMAQQAKL